MPQRWGFGGELGSSEACGLPTTSPSLCKSSLQSSRPSWVGSLSKSAAWIGTVCVFSDAPARFKQLVEAVSYEHEALQRLKDPALQVDSDNLPVFGDDLEWIGGAKLCGN